jgi:hypothetical protein
VQYDYFRTLAIAYKTATEKGNLRKAVAKNALRTPVGIDASTAGSHRFPRKPISKSVQIREACGQ